MCIERILRKLGYVRIQKVDAVAAIPGGEVAPVEARVDIPASVRCVSPSEIRFPSIGESSLSLHSIEIAELPKNRTVVPMDREQRRGLYSALSSACGVGANVGGQATMVSGLYQATASASTLMTYADGTIGSIVMDGGKIASHAGFKAVGMTALAPVAVFSVLSTVTGQYYMKDIKKQLTLLNSRLEQLIQKVEAKNRGELDAVFSSLRILERQKVCSMDDLIFVRQQSATALSLYYYYVEQLKVTLSEDSIDKMLVTNSVSMARDVRLTKEQIERQDLPYLVRMANLSYGLYSLSEMIYFKQLCMMSDKDPYYLVKVQDCIQALGAANVPEHKALVETLENKLIPYLVVREEGASVYKEALGKNSQALTDELADLRNSVAETVKSVGELKQQLLLPFNTSHKLYYDLSTPGEATVIIETGETE